MAVKYIIGLVIGLVATLFFALSAGLAIVVQGTIRSGFFKTCSEVSGTTICADNKKGDCEETWMAVQAGQAFSILSTLLIGFWFILAIFRFVKPIMYFAIGALKFVNYGLLVAALVAGVLNWIIGFAIYGAEFCGTKLSDNNGAEVGPSAPLAFVASCLIVAQIIIECVMADDSPAEGASSEEASASNKV